MLLAWPGLNKGDAGCRSGKNSWQHLKITDCLSYFDRLPDCKSGRARLFCSFKHVFIEKDNEIDQAEEFLGTLEKEFGDNAKLIGEARTFKTIINSKHKDYFLYTFWQVF